jgi:Sigma-70, region 4
MAFLVLLDTLVSVERAVFMLREVFGYGCPEVARITGKTEVNCRQILARVRQRITPAGQARDSAHRRLGGRKARNSPAGSSRPPRAAICRRGSACRARRGARGRRQGAGDREAAGRATAPQMRRPPGCRVAAVPQACHSQRS